MQVLSVYSHHRIFFLIINHQNSPNTLDFRTNAELQRSVRKLRVVVRGTIKHKGNLGYFEINLNLILVV